MPQPMGVSTGDNKKAINSKCLRLNYKEIQTSIYKVYADMD